MTSQECTSCYSNSILNETNCYEKCESYYYYNSLQEYKCTTNNNCPTNYNKLIRNKNQCIDICENDNIYKYEFNNKCYEKCPINTKLIENSYICIDKYENTENNNTEYKYPQNSEEFKREDIDICSEDSPYLYNNNSCIKDCSALDFLNHICKISNSNLNIKQNLILDVINNIKNGTLNDLLSNVINGDKKDIIISEKNIVYQITSSDNQKNKEYENISTVELGECENI